MSGTHRKLFNRITVILLALDKKSQKKIFFIIAFGAVATVSELINIGAIIPLIAILLSPEMVLNHAYFLALKPETMAITPQEIKFYIIVIFCVATFMSALIRQGLLFYQTKAIAQIGNDLSLNVYQKLMFQSYNFYTENSRSEMQAAVIIHTDSIIANIINALITCLNSLLILGTVTIIIVLNSSFAVISSIVGIAAFYYLVTIFYKQTLRQNSLIFTTANDKIVKLLHEGFYGIRDVILTGAQNSYFSKFRSIDWAKRQAEATISFIGAGPRILIETIFLIGLTIAAYSLSKTAVNMQEVLPILGAFVFAAQKMLPLVQTVYASMTLIFGARSSVSIVADLIELEPPTQEMPTNEILNFKNLVFENLTFFYKGSTSSTLEGISLEINKGQIIALIGKSGSGKSTLLDIASGLILVPDKVKINDEPLSYKNAPSWQKNISYLSQFTFLKNGTIRENIVFNELSENVDSQQILECMKHAEIYDDVMNLDKGLDTLVGDGGQTLSGGQIQRIGIARTLFKKAEFFIFDEATSSLDQKTEQKIIQNLVTFHKNKTILISSHRPDILKICDKVFKLDSGKIKQI